MPLGDSFWHSNDEEEDKNFLEKKYAKYFYELGFRDHKEGCHIYNFVVRWEEYIKSGQKEDIIKSKRKKYLPYEDSF